MPESQTTDPAGGARRRPNILLVVSDQERQRGWLPASVHLPWRERLIAEGLEFTRYFTHSSPCSPSRASLITGRYLPGHGVIDNVIMPEHKELDPSMATLGSMLGSVGYRSSYIGKWHLSQSEHPDMEAYGFADWDGNDRHFMGWAGTGVHFDPDHRFQRRSTGSRTNARPAARARRPQPWFLTVALVNPHDVMWFPIDQPGYAAAEPRGRGVGASASSKPPPGRTTTRSPSTTATTTRWSRSCPPTSTTTSTPSPRPIGSGDGTSSTGCGGTSTPADTKAWLRHLDYYVELQRLADESLGTVLAALRGHR